MITASTLSHILTMFHKASLPMTTSKFRTRPMTPEANFELFYPPEDTFPVITLITYVDPVLGRKLSLIPSWRETIDAT